VLVTEKLAQKNQPMLPAMTDPKGGKNASPSLPPRDPQLELLNQGRDEQSFFGSFFKQKKKPGVLEAVSYSVNVVECNGNDFS
jgi:hypothetical protein